ncbi:BnaA08g02060D [Brassica napus]|uniref:BnaA08g02060D protein n=1 Tax=Brassica napus TaxID=3708 RepID=A0A078I920_BRANA|nr:BnaA08g02060D [Brassica napus]
MQSQILFFVCLIPITLAGLFVTAYLQYRRGDQLDF